MTKSAALPNASHLISRLILQLKLSYTSHCGCAESTRLTMLDQCFHPTYKIKEESVYTKVLGHLNKLDDVYN